MPINKEMLYNELKERHERLFRIKLNTFKGDFWKKHIAHLKLYRVTNNADKEFIKKILG